jgi:hypothetical protein
MHSNSSRKASLCMRRSSSAEERAESKEKAPHVGPAGGATHSVLTSHNKPARPQVKAGMVFNVMVGLAELDNPDADDAKGKTYALCVADTVVVKAGDDDASANEVCTPMFTKRCLTSVSDGAVVV